MLIHAIPDKMTVTWNGNVNAVVAKWENYFVSIEEYSEAIVDAALTYGLNNGVKAWIIDAASAKGAFHPDIIKFIETHFYPALVRSGIRDILLIKPKFNALSKLTVVSYTTMATSFGLKLVIVENVTDAIKWLMLNRDTADRWAN